MFLQAFLSFFSPSPDVLTLMHVTCFLTVGLRLGDAFVMKEFEGWLGPCGGCPACREVPGKQGSWKRGDKACI